MRRPLVLLTALALCLVTAPLSTEAQQAPKVHRIGILPPGPISQRAHLWEAFRQGLRELGYVEGQNITLVFPSTEVRPERLREHAAELVRLKVDVIVAATSVAVRAASEATRTIPIVFPVALPVETGLAPGLAHPRGNTTGLTFVSPELSAKRLELLKTVVPKASRIAVLSVKTGAGAPVQIRQTEAAARALKVELQSVEVRGPDDFEAAFQAARAWGADAVITLDDPLIFTHRRRIVELAAKSRLPAIYGFREFVEAGGLMSYAANLADMYRRAATFVDKILKGAKPEDLAIEQPTKFELIINLKTASALGLTIPQSVQLRMDEVIQ